MLDCMGEPDVITRVLLRGRQKGQTQQKLRYGVVLALQMEAGGV